MPYITDMLHDRNSAAAPPPAEERTEPVPVGAFDARKLSKALSSKIVGQQAAVDAVVRAISIAHVGATDPTRPLANILLVGPTGVGKTELVRRVAAELRSGPDDLCRIDMNALAQEHYAASFSGAPPGYAGSKESFTLFDKNTVEGDPYTPGIVLFDEVEKADPTVLRALLQVLDNGELRLANGQQKISFRNSYVFLTSNLGSAAVAERRRSHLRQLADRVRIDRPRHGHHLVQRALEKFFDPEFFNRIDETVILDEFDEQTAEQVTRLEIELITTRLARRGIDVEVEDSAVALLQRRGFDPVYGARGLRRTIRNVLADPVAAAVLDLRPVGTQPLALQARVVGDQIQVKKVP